MSMGRLKKCSDEVTMAVGPTVPGTVVESFSYSDRPIDSLIVHFYTACHRPP